MLAMRSGSVGEKGLERTFFFFDRFVFRLERTLSDVVDELWARQHNEGETQIRYTNMRGRHMRSKTDL